MDLLLSPSCHSGASVALLQFATKIVCLDQQEAHEASLVLFCSHFVFTAGMPGKLELHARSRVNL